jgi:hypothetical protein
VSAENPDESTSMQLEYDKIRQGGALVIDISSLTNLSRQGFVQAIIDILREVCEREIQRGTGRFPFVFFEEAHLYISRNTIGYIVTRSRHLGMTCFFVTNMVGGLDETVLRQVDNLFLLHLPQRAGRHLIDLRSGGTAPRGAAAGFFPDGRNYRESGTHRADRHGV